MSKTSYSKTVFSLITPAMRGSERFQNGYKCTMPDRGQPQYYLLHDGKVLSYKTWKVGGGIVENPSTPTGRGIHSRYPGEASNQFLVNRAYNRFKQAVVGEESQLGALAAEHRESLGMIQRRTHSMYRAYKELRKGNFKRFLDELSVRPKRKHKGKAQNATEEASALWLEYWFGWAPMANDVSSAINQLSEPPPDGRVYIGRSKDFGTESSSVQKAAFEVLVEVGARVKLNDANAFLQNQLGLTNFVAIAWEAIPMSFFADWAFDVSTFLGSFSYFVGLDVTDAWFTEFVKYEWHVLPSANQNGIYKARQRFMLRRTGLPRPLPNTSLVKNIGQSLTRAASSAALLVQILGRN